MSTEDPLYCKCCNYKAKFQSEYNKHVKSQKHLRQGKMKDYKCESCDYTATTHWNLKMHMVLKHYTNEQKKEASRLLDTLMEKAPLEQKQSLEQLRQIVLEETNLSKTISRFQEVKY
jgi:hypothetical protein